MRLPRTMPPRAPRGTRLVLAIALGALASALLSAAEAGDPAPKFANPDLKGNYLSSSKAVGQKWVIVNFFATWCLPCKEELPALEALQLEAGADRLQVIVFATDKEKEKVKEYFEQKPTNLTVLLDPYQVTYLRFNAAEDGLPTIFLLNTKGTIEMKHVGYSPEFIKELRLKILPAGTP